jgi:hypothetical protein
MEKPYTVIIRLPPWAAGGVGRHEQSKNVKKMSKEKPNLVFTSVPSSTGDNLSGDRTTHDAPQP